MRLVCCLVPSLILFRNAKIWSEVRPTRLFSPKSRKTVSSVQAVLYRIIFNLTFGEYSMLQGYQDEYRGVNPSFTTPPDPGTAEVGVRSAGTIRSGSGSLAYWANFFSLDVSIVSSSGPLNVSDCR